MGFGSPIAQNVNPPGTGLAQGVQTLSGLLGLQQQRQQLQLQQQELQRSQVQTQQDLGVNQFFSNWSPGDHHGDDGTLDIDSAHDSPAYQALPGIAKEEDMNHLAIRVGALLAAGLGLAASVRGEAAQLFVGHHRGERDGGLQEAIGLSEAPSRAQFQIPRVARRLREALPSQP